MLDEVLKTVTGVQNGFHKCGLYLFKRIIITDTQPPNNQLRKESTQLSMGKRFRFINFIQSEIGNEKN